MILAVAGALASGVLLGLTYGPPREIFLDPWLYGVGLAGAMALFLVAVFGHGGSEMEEPGHATISWWEVLRHAPVWAIVLCGVSLAALLVSALQMHESSFEITRASMAGRPDRWRFMLSFEMALYGIAAVVAVSALRRRDAWMNVP